MNPEVLQYWATVAQVCPAIAIAVILEARLIQKFLPRTNPRWAVILTQSLWIASLALLAIAEIIAFEVLAGRNVSQWLINQTPLAIQLGISVAVLGPATNFVISNGLHLTRGARKELRLANFRYQIMQSRRRERASPDRLTIGVERLRQLLLREEIRLARANDDLNRIEDNDWTSDTYQQRVGDRARDRASAIRDSVNELNKQVSSRINSIASGDESKSCVERNAFNYPKVRR